MPTLLIKQGITITSSLMYSSVIALAAPIGPLIGLVIADRFERKSVIVAMAAIVVCGLLFSQTTVGAFLIVLGIGLTLASNIMSYSFHAYQAELFPTSIRARAVGFVYSWSRFSAIFSSFVIAAVLKGFGTFGVFAFIAGAMVIVMAAIGFMARARRASRSKPFRSNGGCARMSHGSCGVRAMRWRLHRAYGMCVSGLIWYPN